MQCEDTSALTQHNHLADLGCPNAATHTDGIRHMAGSALALLPLTPTEQRTRDMPRQSKADM